MSFLEDKYQELKNTPSDVNEHFDTIRKYVSPDDIVVELGVRDCVSTWALMANKPKLLIGVDVEWPQEGKLDEVAKAAHEANVKYKFLRSDSVYVDINDIDVLFIDTLHLYSQVVKELWRHSGRTKKYIIFHDARIYEVRACIQDFLFNMDWKFKEENLKGNGLVVLERVKKI